VVDEHADDVAEGFGVPRMVNHFVDVFRPRRHPPPPRHRLGHLLDARLTNRTAESVHPQLGLRMRLCSSHLFHHPAKVKFETSRYSMTMAGFELQKLNKNNIRDVRCKISIKHKYMRSPWTVLNRT
jgi:hypothetical protein